VSSSAISSSGKENKLLVLLSNIDEGRVNFTEVDSSEFTTSFGSEVIAGDFSSGGACLLVNPVDNGVVGAATSVVLALATSEEDQGWEALDFEAFSESVVLGRIYFGDVLGRVLFGECAGSKSIFRGQFLAVTATSSHESNKDSLQLLSPKIKRDVLAKKHIQPCFLKALESIVCILTTKGHRTRPRGRHVWQSLHRS